MSVSYFDCTNYYFDISHPDVDNLDAGGNEPFLLLNLRYMNLSNSTERLLSK